MSAEDFQKTVDEAQGGAAARAFKRTQPGFSLEDKPRAFAAKDDGKGFDELADVQHVRDRELRG